MNLVSIELRGSGENRIYYSCLVRAIYDYEAQGAGELSLQEGQLIQLTDGPSGGRNYADGWWEGEGRSRTFRAKIAVACF